MDSMDWSRLKFTMDANHQKAVKQAFVYYYKNGLIYRDEKVINWCPGCSTSLSDLEIEYQKEKTKLWYIAYPLKNKSRSITVATTRPETMLGGAAVAVNPKDPRYQKFIGEIFILPLKEREILIIADKLIDLNFGSGAVKITPAHDLLDAEISKKNHFSFYKIIGPDGEMTAETDDTYQGLTIGDCRQKIIEELKKSCRQRRRSYPQCRLLLSLPQ